MACSKVLLLLCCCWLSVVVCQNLRYFDPHTHVNGILPWKAYVNLPNYARNREAELNEEEVAELWSYVTNETAKVFCGTGCHDQQVPDDQCPSPNGPYPLFDSRKRIGSGTYATAVMFPTLPDGVSNKMRNGLFDRIFTGTPFTEFDSAYKVRGFALDFVEEKYYNNNVTAQYEDLCDATIRELDHQDIIRSEQSVALVDYIWKEKKLCWLRCFLEQPNSTPTRPHQILTQALTNRLAWSSPNKYSSFESSPTADCIETNYFGDLLCTSSLEKEALKFAKSVSDFGFDCSCSICGNVTKTYEPKDLYDVVVGIDIAAPETTCFTNAGMNHFFIPAAKQLVREAQARDMKLGRNTGHKLLFHIHVGEGFSINYAKHPLSRTDGKEFPDPFTVIPGAPVTPSASVTPGAPVTPPVRNIRSNPGVAGQNVQKLVSAIQKMLDDDDDLDISQHVIFRFGHVTHISRETSCQIGNINDNYPGLIETDINLDSNLVTGAYPIPDGYDMTEINELLAHNSSHFRLNDLPKTLIPDATDCVTVGRIFGGFDALKYLLMYNASVVIPTILGTDGSVVEHANMTRQHQLGQCLIAYWNCCDDEFRMAGVSTRAFAYSTCNHIRNMGRFSGFNFDVCVGNRGTEGAHYDCPINRDDCPIVVSSTCTPTPSPVVVVVDDDEGYFNSSSSPEALSSSSSDSTESSSSDSSSLFSDSDTSSSSTGSTLSPRVLALGLLALFILY